MRELLASLPQELGKGFSGPSGKSPSSEIGFALFQQFNEFQPFPFAVFPQLEGFLGSVFRCSQPTTLDSVTDEGFLAWSKLNFHLLSVLLG